MSTKKTHLWIGDRTACGLLRVQIERNTNSRELTDCKACLEAPPSPSPGSRSGAAAEGSQSHPHPVAEGRQSPGPRVIEAIHSMAVQARVRGLMLDPALVLAAIESSPVPAGLEEKLDRLCESVKHWAQGGMTAAGLAIVEWDRWAILGAPGAPQGGGDNLSAHLRFNAAPDLATPSQEEGPAGVDLADLLDEAAGLETVAKVMAVGLKAAYNWHKAQLASEASRAGHPVACLPNGEGMAVLEGIQQWDAWSAAHPPKETPAPGTPIEAAPSGLTLDEELRIILAGIRPGASTPERAQAHSLAVEHATRLRARPAIEKAAREYVKANRALRKGLAEGLSESDRGALNKSEEAAWANLFAAVDGSGLPQEHDTPEQGAKS